MRESGPLFSTVTWTGIWSPALNSSLSSGSLISTSSLPLFPATHAIGLTPRLRRVSAGVLSWSAATLKRPSNDFCWKPLSMSALMVTVCVAPEARLAMRLGLKVSSILFSSSSSRVPSVWLKTRLVSAIFPIF